MLNIVTSFTYGRTQSGCISKQQHVIYTDAKLNTTWSATRRYEDGGREAEPRIAVLWLCQCQRSGGLYAQRGVHTASQPAELEMKYA